MFTTVSSQKYIDVDTYGKCGKNCTNSKRSNALIHNKCLPDDEMNQYHFYLAFENSFCKDYISEKFFKMYEAGTNVVPVVRGGADYDSYFEPGSFVNAAHFKTAKELALHLKYLTENVDEYAKVLERKLKYRTDEVFKKTNGCGICKFLNKGDQRFTRRYDVTKWYRQCTD